MLSENLFDEVLINPAEGKGIDRLQIVSGFATANMADEHMERLKSIKQPISIELIIGMSRRSGIGEAQHYALCKLAESRPYGLNFACRYVVEGNPVHAKTYCWFSGKKPIKAFVGSANYTLTGFGQSQVEAVKLAEAQTVADFQAGIRKLTADCLSKDIADKITLAKTPWIVDKTAPIKASPIADNTSDVGKTVTLSLLDRRTGKTPARSGINWGQRASRNRNQAYINIPARIGNSDFFPDRYERFTVLTDDRDTFIMVRAQDSGKGLHTTENNALLGEYLRKRIQVPPSAYVTREHLDKYGRTDVTFMKIDEETYLMDFGLRSLSNNKK